MKPKIYIFFVFFFCFTLNTFSQSSVWNSNSFKVTKDISALEDMTGATAITFNNGPVYTSASIPFGGFAFRYGLASYSNFYISPYGYLKLGSPIAGNIPAIDTNIIAALNNGTFLNASYKAVGSNPNSKMVIQYTGFLQPTGQFVSFQIWLWERTGKIQFVYDNVIGLYNYAPFWHYKIFCSGTIMNKNVVASLKTNPNNVLPIVL